jgi:enhancer of polycomb-like protein
MNSEDEIFLTKLNSPSKKSPSRNGQHCREDQFEEVMNFFEQTSAAKQPFASVDNAPVLTYAEMEAAFDETIDDSARRFAKDVYEHWKSRRLACQNNPLMPSLKFERNVDTDDADPYVCFRRREVRQVRKTRGRDAQITEKLKKLRTEMEQARHLLHFTKQREYSRRDQLALDRLIFEQRAAVKDVKRNLGIKGEDQDLINQKVSSTIVSHFFFADVPVAGHQASQARCDGHSHARQHVQAFSPTRWKIARFRSPAACRRPGEKRERGQNQHPG